MSEYSTIATILSAIAIVISVICLWFNRKLALEVKHRRDAKLRHNLERTMTKEELVKMALADTDPDLRRIASKILHDRN